MASRSREHRLGFQPGSDPVLRQRWRAKVKIKMDTLRGRARGRPVARHQGEGRNGHAPGGPQTAVVKIEMTAVEPG
jgi:hypothetical protein